MIPGTTEARCPACGKDMIIRRVDDLNVVEYRARCPGCSWTGTLRELPCGGCHRHRLFEWTGETWRCLRCGHAREGHSPPRALDGYGTLPPRCQHLSRKDKVEKITVEDRAPIYVKNVLEKRIKERRMEEKIEVSCVDKWLYLERTQ